MKKVISMLLITLLLFISVSCSKNTQMTNESTSNSSLAETNAVSSPTSTPTPSPTPTPTPTPIPKLLKAIKYEVIGADRMKIEESEYDSNGNMISVITYSSHGDSEYIYQYDEIGNLISEESHSTYDSSEFNRVVYYEKDDIVQKLLYSSYYDGEISSATELNPVYDGEVLIGLCGTYIYYSYYGEKDMNETWAYTYDDQGRLIENIEKTDTMSTYTIKYTYDDQGRVLSNIETDDYGITIFGDKYTYSESGRLMIHIHEYYEAPLSLYSTGKNHTITTKNEYDEDGLLVKYTEEHSCYSDGTSYTDITTCSYDEYGNIVRTETETQKNGFPETIIYEYENIYDDN